MTRAYRDGAVVSEGFPVEQVSDLLDDGETVIWVDLCGPSAVQLHDLADELGLHELAVEDALGEHQRPKIDHYASHLFIAAHAVRVDRATSELSVMEVDVFVGDRWLITVRKNDEFAISDVTDRWDRSPDLATHGVSFLLYGIFDLIVDGYFDAIEDFDDYYDEVSEGIFSDTPLDPGQQQEWFKMRQSLVRFHRLTGPMREAISGLMRRDQNAVAEAMYPYFQDVYDHVLRATESTDALRDLVSTIVETNLSLRDYRQNLVMKKVTSWAAIIAIPTLITGFYGMNVPYPGFGATSGFWVSVGAIVVLSAALFFVFRRKDWI